uniref:DNA topoisomerase I n=1 Tax=Sphenodon punctatus TaxID=8508 RepID=A0A8D0GDZ2_SPHPU
ESISKDHLEVWKGGHKEHKDSSEKKHKEKEKTKHKDGSSEKHKDKHKDRDKEKRKEEKSKSSSGEVKIKKEKENGFSSPPRIKNEVDNDGYYASPKEDTKPLKRHREDDDRKKLMKHFVVDDSKAKKKKSKDKKLPEGDSKRKKQKKEEEQKWKWWEEERYPEGIKWKFLEHKGPVFAPPYEPLPENVKFYYDGKVMKLSPKAEEVATFFAKMLDHEYTTKDIFRKNFFKDWRKEMTSEEKSTISSLSKCDFTYMGQYFKAQSEARKQMTKDEKQVPLKILHIVGQLLIIILPVLFTACLLSLKDVAAAFAIRCGLMFLPPGQPAGSSPERNVWNQPRAIPARPPGHATISAGAHGPLYQTWPRDLAGPVMLRVLHPSPSGDCPPKPPTQSPYHSRVKKTDVFKNLQLFMENKQPEDDLFDRLNTSILNKHLQDLMEGLTAKVFRTYNASITLQQQLKELTTPDENVPAKILSYNRANRAVAILCNHQRAPPKTFEKSMLNLQTKIDAKKEQLVDARRELKSAKADAKVRRDEKSKNLTWKLMVQDATFSQFKMPTLHTFSSSLLSLFWGVRTDSISFPAPFSDASLALH